MADLKEIKDKDLYKLFDIHENATVTEIRKAYRKKALQFHPDKNPDDPAAATMFHELSEALKVLVDVGARAAYDHVRNARKAAAQRTAKLDEKRKKVKLDLEAREMEAEKREKESARNAAKTLKREIERLREDGIRILEEERLAVKKLLKKEAEESLNNLITQPKPLRVRWKKTADRHTPYTQESLTEIFSKYGDIVSLIVLSGKKRCAVVEFKDWNQARLAHDSELGFPENPLSLSWLKGNLEDGCYQKSGHQGQPTRAAQNAAAPISTVEPSFAQDNDDFEAHVFKKMRMMQERKTKQ